MTNKHIDFDIDDPRASYIAEVMGNKTCKKILSLLAEREMSEGDIASELGIPLNTVGYNINKLLKAGLIEKSKNFFWSVKGKRIPTYKASNKKIVISPKRLITNVPVMVISGLIVALIIVAIIFGTQGPGGKIPGVSSVDNSFKQFSSMDELKAFLKNSSGLNYDVYGRGVSMAETVNAAAPLAKDSAVAGGATDYSGTNVQVAGVDEPDMVKNDGKYIYMVSGNTIFILDAYPAEKMKILFKLEFNGSSVGNIFVNGDKLIVFSQEYNNYPILYETAGVQSKVSGSYMPIRNDRSITNVLIYNIKDRENPVMEGNISVSGNYVDARMIDNQVYLISNEYVYGDNVVLPMHSVNGVEKSVDVGNIYYPPYYGGSYTFTTVSAINVNNNDFNSKIFLMESTGFVYMSEKNIYLSYMKQVDYSVYYEKVLKDVMIPLLPSDLREKANKILDSDKTYYEKQSEVQTIIQDYSMNLSGDEKASFDEKLKNSFQSFQEEMAKENEKTVIHKISVDKNDIKYEGNGEVPGTVLNQFSFDEYKGNLRVATTTGQSWNGNSVNNVYVLNGELKIVGKVEDLAKGEKIYSTRFMGDRAYVVTFKSVDPLFVVDLKDAENPKVLGYLKVPGYSDYLHSYDENHVIGIGRDVNESIDADKVHSPGAIYYTAVGGIKISLFDVSDVEHPVESAKYIIGGRETNSPVNFDHKAFLFSREKGLLVIPINSYSYDGGENWQGVYVFNIGENDISLKGKITHGENNSDYNYNLQIQRSLYMDNTLYTVSSGKVKANDLNDLGEVSSVKIPVPDYGPIPYAL